jgi:arylsulfatase A-like enzyme
MQYEIKGFIAYYNPSKKLRGIYNFFMIVYLLGVLLTLLDVLINLILHTRQVRSFINVLNFFAEDALANLLLILVVSVFMFAVLSFFNVIFKKVSTIPTNRWSYTFCISSVIVFVFILMVQLKYYYLGSLSGSKTKIVLAVLVLAVPVLSLIIILLSRAFLKYVTRKTFRVAGITASVLFGIFIALGYIVRIRESPKAEIEVNDKPNVLIIVIDALRRDHVSCYGYDFVETPNIDAFASRSVIYTDAYTNAPWTIPSMYTMLTSDYPTDHGNGTGFTRDGKFQPSMLSEILRRNGYDTEAYIANSAIDPELGFGRGFSRYIMYEDIPLFSFLSRSTLYLLIETLRELKNLRGRTNATAWVTRTLCDRLTAKRDKPFFIWAHYFDPHQPLAPPSKYITGDWSYIEKTRDFIGRQEVYIEKADKDIAISLYRNEVEYVDDSLKKVFKTLKDEGLLKNTLVIIISDHGEEHFERTRYGHGMTHYDEVMAIPMIIYAPDVSPTVCDYPAAIIDVLPTVVNYVDVGSSAAFEGQDLLALLNNEPSDRAERYILFNNGGFKNRPLKSVYSKPYLFVRFGRNNYQYEIIDTTVEPYSDDILSDPSRELIEKYKEVLDERLSSVEKEEVSGEGDEDRFDVPMRKRMKDLGYF